MRSEVAAMDSPDGHITPHGQRDSETNGDCVQDLREEHVHQQIHGPGIAQILFACKERKNGVTFYSICRVSVCSPGFM